MANYLQRSQLKEGYLVAQAMCTGTTMKIALPLIVPANNLNTQDLTVVRIDQTCIVAKRRAKLKRLLQKGSTILYDQCAQ